MATNARAADSATLRSRSSAPVVPIHTAVRGRARFKVAGLYRSQAMKALLESSLRGNEGVKGVDANPLTGNVLVTFDTCHDVSRVAAMIARAINVRVGKNHVRASFSNDVAGGAGKAARKPRLSEDQFAFREHIASKEEPEHPAWHVIDADAVLARTGSSLATGLSSSSAMERLRRYGANILPESMPRSRLAILLDQLSSTPILLLIAAAGTSILTGGLADAAVILGVVGLNAAIGYVTESQSERTIRSLKNVIRPPAVVIRDGKPQEIPAPQVTLGDILVLGPGSYVAADSRLVDVDRLSLDESALTGESVPVMKTTEKMASAILPLADRLSMVYMGTLVTGGQGLAVVVATGRHTEVGRIQVLTAEAEAPQTPMQRQLDHLGRQLVVMVSGVCVVIFGIAMLRGYPFVSMLQTAIALAVAAVPEGLPTIATTILALGILRMRNLHVLIRRLDAVETLGSVQAICLDKTGTLTLNRMSVVAAHTDGRTFQISNGEFWESGHKIDPNSEPQLQHLLDACVLCSETVIEKHDGAYTLKGSPTENALIHAAIATNRDVMELRRQYPTLKVRLRSEERAFMSTVHRKPAHNGDKQFITFVKGSPEQVFAMCDGQLGEGRRVELTNEDRRAIETQNERMAGNGLRVLGCAWREDECEPANNDDRQARLAWLGLVGLADPIREGMQEVISGFHGAGIDTVMITGDQSPTAFAIGSQLHLTRDGPLQILDSTHLAKLDLEVLKGLVEKVHVFARVSPAHKLQIVRALQRANKVVAMTGDGINDSPALKAADIGIAMGTGGTDVAREVADVVLGDDQLQTMLVAVSQGRTIYTNIRKSVHFLLSTNLSEVIVMFVAMAAGLGQPLSAMQLLWINLVSETSLGLALALDPPEPGVMEQPPRDPNEPIIRPQDLKRMGFEALTLSTGALGAYGYGIARYGIGPRASTLGFTSLISGQILHALSSRSERYTIFDWSPREPNPILSLTVAGSLVLQGTVFLLPWLKNLLGVTSISFADTLVTGAGAVLPLFINEGVKKILFQEPRSQSRAARPQLP
jgi:Ca2+-transporting ATPase